MLHQMKRYERDTIAPSCLPPGPGIFAGFYFSCGPLAGFGLFVGYWQGFVFAIVGDVMLWILIALLKGKYLNCK
jgi:hypothetical protein